MPQEPRVLVLGRHTFATLLARAKIQTDVPTCAGSWYIDRWSYMGRWWAGEGEWRFWRVETTDGGQFELLWDTVAREWRLYRIYD